VSCGRRFMANGTIGFPPPIDSDCEEFLDWDLDAVPTWVCRTAGKCDTGFTRFRLIRFSFTTPSGFYYVFFASDGYVIEQQELLYVLNVQLPADASLLSYRLGLLLGLGGLPLVFNSNLVNRGRIWIQLSLVGMAVFSLISILYFQATIAAYGGPRKVQQELVLCGLLMIVVVGAVALILVRLAFQPDRYVGCQVMCQVSCSRIYGGFLTPYTCLRVCSTSRHARINTSTPCVPC